MKSNYCIFLVVLFINSCGTDGDNICRNYRLVWIDLPSSQTIYATDKKLSKSQYVSIGIPAFVFGVGHDKKFIIAKQHPTNGFEGSFKVDTNITNYYIINMNLDTFEENKVLGPLNITSFDSARFALKIEKIKFDMNYPEYY
jgi:hypothetical protein